MADQLKETRKVIERIQKFDPKSLPRKDELGSVNFADAVAPAKKLIGLYKQLSVTALADLPPQLLTSLLNQANADFTFFQQILDFVLDQENPGSVRNSYIQNIKNAYHQAFPVFYHFIPYGTSKTADFKRLETDARSTMQSIRDHAEGVTKELEKSREQANKILEDVQKVAAEQGVSQQASYFKSESTVHKVAADNWCKITIGVAIALGLYSISTLFLHKIPSLKPEDNFQSVQLVASKVLIFAVLSYMLILSAKNFLSHKHNAIVNKHRQNALMTFTALVDASGTEDGKEVILSHASACIFSPQETGYVKPSGDSGNAKSVIELLPSSINKIDV